MLARHTLILTAIRSRGKARVEDLSELLDTTPQTIRKDLRLLESAGHVIRFHGGARLRAGGEYLAYAARADLARTEKQAIGAAAVAMLTEGATVFLNAGTTTEAAARALPDGQRLRVIADNVNIANITSHLPGVSTIVAGGEVRPGDGAILGAAAVDFLSQFRADFALVGAAAIAPDGTMLDHDLEEAMIVRTMMRNAATTLVLVDSAKFGATAPVCIGHLENVAGVITDHCPAPSIRNLCAAAGVALHEVMPSQPRSDSPQRRIKKA